MHRVSAAARTRCQLVTRTSAAKLAALGGGRQRGSGSGEGAGSAPPRADRAPPAAMDRSGGSPPPSPPAPPHSGFGAFCSAISDTFTVRTNHTRAPRKNFVAKLGAAMISSYHRQRFKFTM